MRKRETTSLRQRWLRWVVFSLFSCVGLTVLLSTPASAEYPEYDPTVPEYHVYDDKSSPDYGEFFAMWPATASQLLSDGALASDPSEAQWPRVDTLPESGLTIWDDYNPFEGQYWPRSQLWMQGGWNVKPGLDPQVAMQEIAGCLSNAEIASIRTRVQYEVQAENIGQTQPQSQAEYDALLAQLDDVYQTQQKDIDAIWQQCYVMAADYFPGSRYADGESGINRYSSWQVQASRFDMTGLQQSYIGADGIEYSYRLDAYGFVSQLPEDNVATLYLMRWNCSQTLNLDQIYAEFGSTNSYRNPGQTQGLDLCTDGLSITPFQQTLSFDPKLREVKAPTTERERQKHDMGQYGFLISWMDPTTFSELAPFEGLKEELPRIGVASGVALTFTALAALPSQLLSATLMENRMLFDKWFGFLRRRKNNPLAVVEEPELPADETAKPKKKKLPPRSWTQRILKPRGIFAFIALLLAAVIAGYSQPDFVLDLDHLRIVIWLFLGYIIVNVFSTIFGHIGGGPTRKLFALRTSARLDFLVLLALTVLFTRATGALPAIVFGAVLALELINTGGDGDKEKKFASRTVIGTTIYVFIIGIAAWIAYSKYPPFLDLFVYPGLDALAKELLAVIAIEALTTAPLVLLPIAFLPGQLLWNRSKILWGVSYLIAVALFMWVVIRMPQSWSALPSAQVGPWITVLVIYSLFAVGVWALFKFFLTRQREDKSINNTDGEAVKATINK